MICALCGHADHQYTDGTDWCAGCPPEDCKHDRRPAMTDIEGQEATAPADLDDIRTLVYKVGPYAMNALNRFERAVRAESEARIADLEESWYLPLPCPNCGRMRLLAYASPHRVRCEKCEIEGSTITDFAERAEARERELLALNDQLRDDLQSTRFRQRHFTLRHDGPFRICPDVECEDARAIEASRVALRFRSTGRTCCGHPESAHVNDMEGGPICLDCHDGWEHAFVAPVCDPAEQPRCATCGHAKNDMPRETHYFGDGHGMRTFCMVPGCTCEKYVAPAAVRPVERDADALRDTTPRDHALHEWFDARAKWLNNEYRPADRALEEDYGRATDALYALLAERI